MSGRRAGGPRAPSRTRRRRRRLLPVGARPVGSFADVARAIAHEPDDERQDQPERRDRHQQRGVAPVEAGDPGQERQEDELPRGVARGQDSRDETTPGDEPAVGDDCCKRHRDSARRRPVDDAPEEKELPRLGHPDRQERRDGDDRERTRDDPPHAEAFDQGGGERCAEAEAEEVERDRETDRLVTPAELLVERHEEDAGGRAKARGHDERDEADRDDHPRVPPLPSHEASLPDRRIYSYLRDRLHRASRVALRLRDPPHGDPRGRADLRPSARATRPPHDAVLHPGPSRGGRALGGRPPGRSSGHGPNDARARGGAARPRGPDRGRSRR